MSSVNTRNVNYQKRWEFNGTALPTEWSILQLGSGMTVTVSGGVLTIATGTTASAETIIRCSKPMQLKFLARFIAQLSQRIANQTFFLEITNEAGTTYARWNLDGTSATTGRFESANGGVANTSSTITIPTTATYNTFEIYAELEQVLFTANNSNSNTARAASAILDRNVPEPGEDYYVQIRAVNGSSAPASTTSLQVDSVFVESLETMAVEIIRGPGDDANSTSMPVRTRGGTIDTITTVTGAFISPRAVRFSDTTANLTASATFTGASRDVGSTALYDTLRAFCLSSHAGTFAVDQSVDGTTWFQTHSFAVTGSATVAQVFEAPIVLRYVRVRLVNGATPTTTVRVETKLLKS